MAATTCCFVLNRPQRKLVNALEAMRREGRPIRLILLKARQWGGSTRVQLYMSWLQLVHEKGLNSLIIAHQGAATDEIKDMFDRTLRLYPSFLLHEPGEKEPEGEKRVERVGGAGAAFRVIARNCKVKVGTAERPDFLPGRRLQPCALLGGGAMEGHRTKSPEQILRAACSGVLLKPMTMILFESTANGTGNFFHREYEAARRGESQFRPLFVAWYEIEQYSLPFAPGERENFAAQLVEGREAMHAVSGPQAAGPLPLVALGEGATLEAIHWYVSERSKYSDHGLMAAEYPSDDVEAFVHSGARVFDKYKVGRPAARMPRPAHEGEIDGDAPQGRSRCAM